MFLLTSHDESSLICLQISGYTLSIQAEDNGNPPRKNITRVNIDVSDINDNPPVFSRENYSIIIQVGVRLW